MFSKETTDYTKVFYSKDINYKIMILKTIYNSSKGVNTNELIEKIKIERRTIYKYIKEINDLSELKYNNVYIRFVNHSRYIFSGAKLDLKKVIIAINETTYFPHFILDFIVHGSVNFQKFCLDHHIGENTCRKQLHVINRWLKKFDLSLVLRQGHLKFIGDEFKVRNLLVSLIWRFYQGIKWPFPNVSKDKINSLVSFIFSDSNKSLSIGRWEEFSYMVAVSLSRAQSKYLIAEREFPPYYKDLISLFPRLQVLYSYLKNHTYLPDLEIRGLLVMLQTIPEYVLHIEGNSQILKKLEEKYSQSYLSIRNFVEFTKEQHSELSLNSEEGQMFISAVISARIFTDVFHSSYFTVPNLSIISYTMEKFPNLLPSIYQFVDKSEQYLDMKSKHSLTLRYAQAYCLIYSPQDFEPFFKIKIETNMPAYVEKNIITKIHSILSPTFNYQLNSQITDLEYDLLITTNFVEQKTLNIPVLVVNAEISDRDIHEILEVSTLIVRNMQHKK